MINETALKISGWYDINPHFADLLLRKFIGAEYNTELQSVANIYSQYPNHRQQLEYAFSTNVRGKQLASYLQSLNIVSICEGEKYYLDIGSAYAGFLMAFSNKGYKVTGVEFDEELADLGRANLSYCGVEGNISTGDFLSNEVVTFGEEYDLITCNDVIEHIVDPRAAIKKICNILKPGGYAYIETVNKRSIVNVRSEIHSGLFGISLLDHHSSNAAYKEYNKSNAEFQISDFYYIDWYMNLARSCGAIVEEVYGPNESPVYEAEIKNLWDSYQTWEKQGSHDLSFYSRYEIKKELFRYSMEFFRQLSIAHEEHDYDRFNRKWVDPIIRFTIHKPEKKDF